MAVLIYIFPLHLAIVDVGHYGETMVLCSHNLCPLKLPLSFQFNILTWFPGLYLWRPIFFQRSRQQTILFLESNTSTLSIALSHFSTLLPIWNICTYLFRLPFILLSTHNTYLPTYLPHLPHFRLHVSPPVVSWPSSFPLPLGVPRRYIMYILLLLSFHLIPTLMWVRCLTIWASM